MNTVTSETEQVWIIDDDNSIRWVLEKALNSVGLSHASFNNAAGLLDRLEQQQPDAIITDIRMPGMDGLALMERVHAGHPELPIIVMTAHSDLDSAIAAYEGGAFEYLPKPFDVDEATDLIQRAIKQHRRQLTRPALDTGDGPEIIGKAAAMQEVFRAIGRLSKSKITALITGESGTGKELVAQALHRHSPRAEGPFIALNTAAIPKDLLESELFGHERGAFTGAQNQRQGRFEQANGGTLFLDEIGDMPVDLQTRLLRVLADGSFYRVGGHTEVKVDVRIITATHQNLEHRVQEGLFREDLYHRLNVIRIHIPAIRERREDIPLLTQHFLQRAARELGVETKRMDTESEQFLKRYSWPGNVRQLENVCRWLTVMSPGQIIHLEDMPPELSQDKGESDISEASDWETALANWASRNLANGETALLDQALPRFERVMITAGLKQSGGRRQDAAHLLGWGRNTLTRKIKELDMEKADTTEQAG